MITNMREIHPDETIYSWFAWYHKISGNLSVEDTMFELLDCHMSDINCQEFGFKSICEKLPETFNYNPEYLIRKHTLFPLFKPFMSVEKSERYLDVMIGNQCIHRNSLMNVRQIDVENDIKICPECYIEDKNRYGEAYFHRTHQIFGNFVCYKHKVDLISIAYDRKKFIDLEQIEEEIREEKIFAHEKFISISNNLNKLLNSESLYEKNFNEVKEIYKHRLIEKGYWKPYGQIYQKKLVNDFIDFYSPGFLSKFNSNLENENNWLKTMLTNKRNKLTHPVRHVLLIKFLFEDIDGFENYKRIEFKPFGIGPWPCLNSCCSDYKQDVINRCNISKDKKHNLFRGTFICPNCEFTYLRRNTNSSNDDKFKVGRVVSYGQLWDNKLISTASNGQYSLRELAMTMGVSRDTIKIQSKRLNIGTGALRKQNIRRQGGNSKDVNKLDEYKSNVLKLIKQNSYITKSKIRNTLSKEYEYIYRNDRTWFEENLPKSIQTYEAMQKFSEQYWISRENEIYIKVINAIEEILTEIPSKRITKKYIAQKINYHGIINPVNLNKMPIINNLLDSKCESIEQFKHRNILSNIK